MFKLLYFKSVEDFKEHSINEIMEAHFVAYREGDGNYFVVKNKCGACNRSFTESAFKLHLVQSINEYQDIGYVHPPFDRASFMPSYSPQYHAGDVVAWKYVKESVEHFAMIEMYTQEKYYFDTPIAADPQLLKSFTAYSRIVDQNLYIRKATKEEKEQYIKNKICKTNSIQSSEYTKEETEIWKHVFDKYSANRATDIDNIFKICDRAVKSFRKTVQGN